MNFTIQPFSKSTINSSRGGEQTGDWMMGRQQSFVRALTRTA